VAGLLATGTNCLRIVTVTPEGLVAKGDQMVMSTIRALFFHCPRQSQVAFVVVMRRVSVIIFVFLVSFFVVAVIIAILCSVVVVRP
jgi:hypothetical protein